MLRPVGSPLPLGMIGLGAGSVLLSAEQLRWVPAGEAHLVAVAVLAFTVPLQGLASVFGFLSRDGAGGTGMALLGGSWLATGVLTLLTPPGGRSQVLGLLLWFVAAALVVPVTAAALGKLAAATAFALAGVRFALTGAYERWGGTGWEHASGWLGVALSVVALYCALAFEVEDTEHRSVLPVGRHGAGRRAMDGNLLSEVDQVAGDAGVRQQL